MNPAIPYVACVVGAVGLYLLLRPSTGDRSKAQAMRAAGTLLGLGAFAWLLVESGRQIGARDGVVDSGSQLPGMPGGMFLVFSLIAVASAVRMITHARPVYSALYFVMVVLSSAGLFLLLQAEFMAFALVIVYAGAILITYIFVLMLAQQAPDADQPDMTPEYDRIAREPGMAATVGFILVALFTHMVFGAGELSPIGASEPIMVMKGDAKPSNIELVGLDLVAKFPVSLEVAGVILLMAMFGAVVLARKQMELGEDEVREAAGMRKLSLHSDHADDEMHNGGST